MFAFPGGRPSFRRDLHAAIVHDPAAVVSHRAAARVHRCSMLPRVVCEVTTDSIGRERNPFAVVHSSIDLFGADVVFIDGLPVTSLARTMADLLMVLSRKRVERMIDDLLSSRRIMLDDLIATHGRYARSGRPTTVAMREIITERSDVSTVTGSILEDLALAVFERAGFPEPEKQHPVPGWTSGPGLVDLAWPAHRVLVELDGRRWHSRDEAFERDRERDHAAILAGWAPLRFTHAHLRRRPDYVIRVVRKALEQGRQFDSGTAG